MTKPTLPQLSKYGFWLLPVLILPLPILGLVQWRSKTEPNYTVIPQPLASPSSTFSTFPFLKAKSGSPPPATPFPPHRAQNPRPKLRLLSLKQSLPVEAQWPWLRCHLT
ncbi:MAG: hypothetical protein HC852_00930 [Acaryochloridaceae cyanobacterium RU_4_10]|nr:hypothetical protein [Acaryochloridaceae cyanobacterium RU_4_10]